MTAEELMGELAKRDLGYEVISHHPTMSAREEAAAIGLPAAEVAKTLVLFTSTGHVRVVLQASERLDMHKVHDLLGDGKHTRLATEAELAEAYPMFE